ncbi:hypothetical protein HDF26_000992 [Pedobacter cryoconitis]|nr:hypothetical protein [Pedobacter cryoconitis]MBB6270565.1 hypothetical protein [Pedobacter cryoconitis]
MKFKVKIIKQAFKLHGWLRLYSRNLFLLYSLSGSALILKGGA